MIWLLDSNVWAALTIDRHEHHGKALRWFDRAPDDRSTCFCRMTQNSFLRLISSERIFREDAVSNREAIAIYSRFRSDPRIGWIDEPAGLETVWLKAATHPSPSPKRWMDGYLFAYALLSSAVIVTFDGGFRQYQSRGLKVEFLA
jgi:uncharacterized protein